MAHHCFSSFFAALLLISVSLTSVSNVSGARHLLETTLPDFIPEIPKPELPDLPDFPTIPEPELPSLPTVEIPEVPTIPTLPDFPEIPKPTFPTIPDLAKGLLPEATDSQTTTSNP